jgi:hypothetical protein
MMYLASWFILSKYDPSGWVVLGLLLLAPKMGAARSERQGSVQIDRLVPGVVGT